MITEKPLNTVRKINVDEMKRNIQSKFKKVFSNDMFQPIKDFEAEIILKPDAPPIFCKPYSVPFGLREKVEEELDRLVKEGILIPIKHSNRASPIIVVKKTNGSIRICVDCKKTINRYVETEQYPLPVIEDILADLAECKIFCVLDLTGAYQQLAVSKRSQEYLTINTHKGLFKFTRLVFGVAPAPAIFQSKMDDLLKDIENVKCYFDDVCIGGKTIEECEKNLLKVLERFDENGVRVNLSKCKFFEKEIEYLGHIISDGSLRPNEKKIGAVLNAEAPKNVAQLQSYLGMINYYSKFIPNLSSLLHPLYILLKKNAHFVWTEEHNSIFEKCKKLLASKNVLSLYDPKREIIIASDASPYGVGGVMSQIVDGIERPVMFASSTLSPAENY